MTDQDLRGAFRALRDKYEGHHPDEAATLGRALLATRKRERRRSVTRWVVLPIAAVLVASTAWAGANGKLTPAVRAIASAVYGESKEQPAATPAPAPLPPPPPIASAAPEPEPTPEPEPAPAPSPPPPIAIAPPPRSAPVVAAPPPSSAAPAADPATALFSEAHRLHFVEKDPARALAAWDAYLRAAPNGRFAPEARYNHALALVRLGRVAEAKRELAPFADGTFGAYRRDEARSLLEALDRDAH
jgi:hypothetical protein